MTDELSVEMSSIDFIAGEDQSTESKKVIYIWMRNAHKSIHKIIHFIDVLLCLQIQNLFVRILHFNCKLAHLFDLYNERNKNMFSLKGVECWTEIYMYKWGIRFTFASVLLFHQANFAVNVLKYFEFKNKKSGDHSSQDEISQFNDQIFSSFRVFFLCIQSNEKERDDGCMYGNS